jgi:hypothetical protein
MYTPLFSPLEFRSPSRHFCISMDKKRVAYCYIRKNACTSFKYLLSRKPTIAIRVKKAIGLKNYNDRDHLANIKHLLIRKDNYKNGDYHETIFVYRNPVDRAISTYLNKFVASSGAADIHRNYRSVMARNPENATFLDFLMYAGHDFSDIDCHLWPQKAHLWDIEYSRAIDINSLYDEMTELIGSTLAEKFFSKRSNATESDGCSISDSLIDVSAVTLRDMKQRGASFDKSSFLSSETEEIIERRYKDDYEMMRAIRMGRNACNMSEAGPTPKAS